jgi:2-polyprenyl-3-methyl-5-hydroxy-6-metoxy-1,4-benzoquinol methylase
MMNQDNYLIKNKMAWKQRTQMHIHSEFYNQASFLEGRNSLKDIELGLLADVKSKKILHLQCHFGQDTLSLARMGAKVCGVDFSYDAIAIAQATKQQLQLDAQFICCDVYDLPQHLNKQFDIVFTSYGTIGWLPDIAQWASIVSQYLKKNGEFIFVEFHPLVWMFDNELKEISYRYFNGDAIVETEEGSYADKSSKQKIETITWNHGLAEVIQSLLNEGLELLSFEEYDYSPYDVFPNSIEIAASKYRVKHLDAKIPLVYSLKMRKK